MILDILLMVFSTFLQAVEGLFRLIAVPIPDQFESSVVYFIAKLAYVQSFINVPDILEAIGWFMITTTAYLLFRTIIWALRLIPWFGKNIKGTI